LAEKCNFFETTDPKLKCFAETIKFPNFCNFIIITLLWRGNSNRCNRTLAVNFTRINVSTYHVTNNRSQKVFCRKQ